MVLCINKERVHFVLNPPTIRNVNFSPSRIPFFTFLVPQHVIEGNLHIILEYNNDDNDNNSEVVLPQEHQQHQE